MVKLNLKHVDIHVYTLYQDSVPLHHSLSSFFERQTTWLKLSISQSDIEGEDVVTGFFH